MSFAEKYIELYKLTHNIVREEDEALIKASYFLDMADFLQVGIAEDQLWRFKYHWRNIDEQSYQH